MRASRPRFIEVGVCCVIGAQRGSGERLGTYSAAAKDFGLRNKNERVGGVELAAGDALGAADAAAAQAARFG